MENRELRYFVALAEELHFARAAARVGIEQSPLSKAITEMERHLGVQLFIRTRRGTRLTYVGEILLQDARRILAAVEQARHNIRCAAAGRRGRLRIAVCDGVAQWRIAKFVAEARREDPALDIQIVHSALLAQPREICSGALDIGFTLCPSKDTQLRCVPVWHDAVCTVMRADHPLSAHHTIRHIGSEIGNLILLGERSDYGAETTYGSALLLREQCGSMEYVASVELLLTLVGAGYGVGLVGASLAEQVRRPDVVVRLLEVPGATFTTFLIHRSDDPSVVVAQFTERVQRMV
jgi:DNA-binding transcriptional LysR family regulator